MQEAIQDLVHTFAPVEIKQMLYKQLSLAMGSKEADQWTSHERGNYMLLHQMLTEIIDKCE